MTSNHHAPYDLGYTRTTMATNKGMQYSDMEQTPKNGLSSDCRLKLAYMKPESLVMAHQLRRREYVPGPCTHRPSHHGSGLHPKSLCQPARGTGAEGMDRDWDEVVTR